MIDVEALFERGTPTVTVPVRPVDTGSKPVGVPPCPFLSLRRPGGFCQINNAYYQRLFVCNLETS